MFSVINFRTNIWDAATNCYISLVPSVLRNHQQLHVSIDRDPQFEVG